MILLFELVFDSATFSIPRVAKLSCVSKNSSCAVQKYKYRVTIPDMHNQIYQFVVLALIFPDPLGNLEDICLKSIQSDKYNKC